MFYRFSGWWPFIEKIPQQLKKLASLEKKHIFFEDDVPIPFSGLMG